MSGSFENIDVPPTLVSFAVDYTKASHIVSPEFKKPGNSLLLVEIPFDSFGIPDYQKAGELYDKIHCLTKKGVIISAYALGPADSLRPLAK